MVLWFVPLIAAGIKALAVCACVGGTCYCAKKAHDAYKKGQKTKQLKYQDREAARQAALESNKRLDDKDKELEEKIKQGSWKEKQLEKEANEIKEKLDDPNIPKEKKEELQSQLFFIQTQLDDIKKENKTYLNEQQRNNEQRKQNNQIINSTGLAHDGDRSWVWEVLTLENILIMLAIYAVWKIVRDEQR